MKATELRIGNLADVNGKVVKIESISDLTVSVSGYREDGGETTIRLKNLEPIPLTEEWLLKLPNKFTYPKWIKHVHILQNWYWVNNKCEKELEIKERQDA